MTGYGVIDKNGNYLRHVVHGEIRPRKESLLSEVLTDIFHKLGAVIAEAHPQAVALENIFYGKNVRSLIRQAQVRGVVIYACADRECRCTNIRRWRLKKRWSGTGGRKNGRCRRW